jgi:hypothetical protein
MKIRNAKADFASQEPRVLHFGLGTKTAVERLVVVWPDGKEHVFEELEANQRIVVNRNGTLTRRSSP